MKMKKILFVLPLLFVCVFAHAEQYRAALVADMDTGRVLISENINEPSYPASLTKIMTLYLTFHALSRERLSLDDYLIVSKEAANTSPVKLGLVAGEKIRVEDAIYALAVHSANDAAVVLAENLKGGIEGKFSTSVMTTVANDIGLKNTNFENSSGLPDDDHVSTARDIALLAMAVYRHYPQYWKYFGVKTWEYKGKTYTNGNRLLGTYPGCDGMKTGYTNKSKYSLVASAKRDGHRLLLVLLGAENKDVRAEVAAQMLDRGFAMIKAGALDNVKPLPPVQKTVQKSSETKPVTLHKTQAPVASPVVQKYATDAYSIGGTSVQCGAFSSKQNAEAMVVKMKNVLGANPHIETTDSMLYRVRVSGLTESSAQDLYNRASAAGISCIVVH